MGHVSIGRKYEMKMHVLGSSVPASVRPGQSSSLASEQDVSFRALFKEIYLGKLAIVINKSYIYAYLPIETGAGPQTSENTSS
jgi:hypothetical protein